MDLREYIESQRVKLVGHRPPVTVTAETSIADTTALMRLKKVGCVLVAEERTLKGIFTERDLLRKVLSADAEASMQDSISSVMTENPVVVKTDDALVVLLRRMHKGGFRHIPLLDAKDRVVGTISMKRVVSFVADQFAEAVYNLPPSPENYGRAREGA